MSSFTRSTCVSIVGVVLVGVALEAQRLAEADPELDRERQEAERVRATGRAA